MIFENISWGSGKMKKNNRRYILEASFLKECLKFNVNLNEFLVLMYFDNDEEGIFDVNKIAKTLCLNEKDVLNAFGTLMDKNIITLDNIKDEKGKIVDKVSLDNLYNIINDKEAKDKKNQDKNDLFTKFQNSYGHSLSGMDFEIINAWLLNGYTEDIILGALEEANYNGVASLRYIDKILHEWNKKGFKKMEDVKNHLKKKNNSKIIEESILDYNWLDE